MDRIAEIETEMRNSYIYCIDNGLIIPPKRNGTYYKVPTSKKSGYVEHEKALKVYFDVLESRLPQFVGFLKANDIIRVAGKGNQMHDIDVKSYLHSVGLIGDNWRNEYSTMEIIRRWSEV